MRHLIIGGGSIGKRHLKNLFLLGEEELFCLRRSYDSDFEKEYRCRVLVNYDEVKRLKPDAVYVCTPTSLHYDGLALAQDIGAHLFMEKPLVHDEKLLQSAIQTWKNNKVFFIGFVLRYHPLFKILREKIKEKAIGDVFCARFEFGSYLPNWHPDGKAAEGYAGVKRLGGGVINTITHELDMMISLFSAPESVVSVKANLDYLHVDVEELAESIFRYPWGLATLHLDFLQKEYERRISIIGTEGKIIWNWKDDQIIIQKVSNQKEIIESKNYQINQLYLDELKDFINLIRNNRITHPLDFECAVTNTQWMLAMHKSAETEILWEK